MKKKRIQGDSVTYQTLLKGCIQFKKYDQAVKILEDAIQNHVEISKDVSESLFSGISENSSEELQQKVQGLKDQLKRCRFNNKGGYKKQFGQQNKFNDKKPRWNKENQGKSYNKNSNYADKENSNQNQSNWSKPHWNKAHWGNKPNRYYKGNKFEQDEGDWRSNKSKAPKIVRVTYWL
jgi:pentatricopeptide repeat protein